MGGPYSSGNRNLDSTSLYLKLNHIVQMWVYEASAKYRTHRPAIHARDIHRSKVILDSSLLRLVG